MANTYPTSQYPLGSTNVKVLYNNASNTDEFTNSPALNWTDRFGDVRKTIRGIETDAANALSNTGFEFIGDYDADGPLTLTRQNQTFTKDGEYWRPAPTLVLPFVTTGNWVADEPNFVMNGDASLRTALADPSDPLNGAAMIARGVQVVNSFDALGLLSKTAPSQVAMTKGHHAAYHGYGSNLYRLDPADVSSPEVKGVCKVAGDGGRWKLIHNGVINIETAGCVPIVGVDNFADLQAIIAYAYVENIGLSAGSGKYEYGTTLDLSYPGVHLAGVGYKQTIFKYTGINRAMDSLGTRPNNGAFSIGITLRDFTIEGNPNVSDLLRIRINHCRLVNINAREASTINGCGFRIEGTVVGCFDNIICSTNQQLMSSRPLNGLVVDFDPTDFRRATANIFINPVIEGMTGDGTIFTASDAAIVTGGTSENNGANGLTVSAGCQMNTFINLDCESNLGFADIFDGGQCSTFTTCGTTKKFYVDNSSLMTTIEGGWHDLIELGIGAVGTSISRVKVRFFGGAVGFISNNNPFFSAKEIWDVQAAAFIYPVKPVTTIVVPASGAFTYTNNNPFAESIVITGGTYSALVLNRGVAMGVAALPLTGGMYYLQPGDGISFSGLSVAPTAHRVPGGANFG